MMSTRSLGWPTSWRASPDIRPATSTNCCRGIGSRDRPRAAKLPDHGAISAVFTIGYIANLLGEDEDWLHDLSIDMFPEDGLPLGLRRRRGRGGCLHPSRHRQLAPDHRR